MHLYWNMDENLAPLVEASAVLEILEAPTVAKTYFWALQASFTDDNGTDHGAAHLGLQWYPPHPNSGAVNWGGYPPQHSNWQVTLTGSESPLPSTTDDPNTRDYPWQVGVRYRLRIFRSPTQGWRATITDLSTGTVDLVRDLWLGGNQVKSLIVWTEWFCTRRDPTVSVRWSEFVAIDSYGVAHAPESLTVNHPADGFTNTAHVVEEFGPHAKVLRSRPALARLRPGKPTRAVSKRSAGSRHSPRDSQSSPSYSAEIGIPTAFRAVEIPSSTSPRENQGVHNIQNPTQSERDLPWNSH
jgi:hypothetical protein